MNRPGSYPAFDGGPGSVPSGSGRRTEACRRAGVGSYPQASGGLSAVGGTFGADRRCGEEALTVGEFKGEPKGEFKPAVVEGVLDRIPHCQTNVTCVTGEV